MNVLSLISGLIKIAGLIGNWLAERRLISQGKKEQMNESLRTWKDQVDRALDARRSVRSDADSLRDDPDRRD